MMINKSFYYCGQNKDKIKKIKELQLVPRKSYPQIFKSYPLFVDKMNELLKFYKKRQIKFYER